MSLKQPFLKENVSLIIGCKSKTEHSFVCFASQIIHTVFSRLTLFRHLSQSVLESLLSSPSDTPPPSLTNNNLLPRELL